MSKAANSKVAVIGLGSMGFGMAQTLIRAGFDVVGCDVSAERVEELGRQGGGTALSPVQAAEGADAVVTVVVTGAQTEKVLFGADGAMKGLPAGGVVISCATMAPDLARDLAARTEAEGRYYVDAPISGGAARAARGELTVLASGPEQAFAKARPVLDAMSASLHDLGREAGLGAAFKMINQLLAGVHIAAACEAISFAAKQGLDLAKVYDVITGAAGNSWMFENRVPHILSGDYRPLSAVDIFVKDLGIIQDMARTELFPVPVAAAALQMFLATSGAGMGMDDDSSVARTYAKLAGIELPASALT